jgi:hypothetical protein
MSRWLDEFEIQELVESFNAWISILAATSPAGGIVFNAGRLTSGRIGICDYQEFAV